MGTLHWRSPVPPFVAAALLLGLGVWLVVLYRRQRAQHSLRRTAALLLPKAAVVLLVMLAYFDPVWRIVRSPDVGAKIAVLIDDSSSMQVPDAKEGPRAARAARLFEDLKSKLGSVVAWDAYEFDQQVRPYKPGGFSSEQVRETDLGMCLAAMGSSPTSPSIWALSSSRTAATR